MSIASEELTPPSKKKNLSLCGVPTERMKPAQSAARCPEAAAAAAGAGRGLGGQGRGREGREQEDREGAIPERSPTASLGGRSSLRSRDAANARFAAAVTPPSMDPTSRGVPYRCSLRWKFS